MSRWAALSRVRASAPAMPTTPFSGVRISWLMLATNRLLAWLAASAASRAASSSSSSRLRAEMSMTVPIIRCASPSGARFTTRPRIRTHL